MPLSGRAPDAVEVIPGLRIGSCPSRRQARRLADDGVNCVVDLRAEAPHEPVWPQGFPTTRVALVDHGTPSVTELRDAAEEVRRLIGEGHQILLHCRMGLERAPTVAAATLMLQGWSFGEALDRVRSVRPRAMPTRGQLEALRGLERELAPPAKPG